MKKKITALLLVLVMVMTCFVACGDKDKKDEEKKKSSYKDIYEMLEDIGKVDKGTVTLSADFDLGQEGNGKITVTLGTDGKGNASIGASVKADVKDAKLDFAVDDLMVVKDKFMYLNLGGILKAVSGIEPDAAKMLGDIELDYFAIPLPDDLETKTVDSVKNDGMKLVVDFLKKALADAKISGEDTDFTVEFTSVKSYQTVLNTLADYLEKDVLDTVKNSTKDSDLKNIDLNKYVEKLINYYYDDVVELAGALEMSKEDVDKMIEEIKKEDLNQALESEAGEIVDLEEIEGKLKEAAAQIREEANNLTEEDIKGIDLKFNVKSVDGGFKLKGTMVASKDGKEAKIDATVRISGDVPTISAPSKITRLRDFKPLISMLLGSLGGLGGLGGGMDFDD